MKAGNPQVNRVLSSLATAEWDESAHPRGADGKFGEGGGGGVDQHAKDMQDSVSAPHKWTSISKLGGPNRPSVVHTLSLDPKETWQNGIMENSRYTQFHMEHTGKLSQFTNSTGIKNFRATNVKSGKEAAQKINAWLAKDAALNTPPVSGGGGKTAAPLGSGAGLQAALKASRERRGVAEPTPIAGKTTYKGPGGDKNAAPLGRGAGLQAALKASRERRGVAEPTPIAGKTANDALLEKAKMSTYLEKDEIAKDEPTLHTPAPLSNHGQFSYTTGPDIMKHGEGKDAKYSASYRNGSLVLHEGPKADSPEAAIKAGRESLNKTNPTLSRNMPEEPQTTVEPKYKKGESVHVYSEGKKIRVTIDTVRPSTTPGGEHSYHLVNQYGGGFPRVEKEINLK